MSFIGRAEAIMIGGILALATAAWFYTTATEVNKNPWLWAALGFICFQGVFTISAKIVLVPLSIFIPNLHDSGLLQFVAWLLVFVLSATTTAFVRRKYLQEK